MAQPKEKLKKNIISLFFAKQKLLFLSSSTTKFLLLYISTKKIKKNKHQSSLYLSTTHIRKPPSSLSIGRRPESPIKTPLYNTTTSADPHNPCLVKPTVGFPPCNSDSSTVKRFLTAVFQPRHHNSSQRLTQQ